ncbi:glycosyltransferase [Alteromonas sediminis]|uniref:Glycosyltransferase n=1 Tax=Alteromonas sediminis TaxID=2259342 RepID=A0A3N5YF51_9ALTE|nr:sugar transferase [Alteromonas sediminis]RPJ68575.1 glycosyltransferase [Alteromonas sediminis]
MFHSLLLFITTLSIFLVIYHHIGYPIILKLVAKVKNSEPLPFQPRNYCSDSNEHVPSICIVIPAFNEAQWVSDKITNLAFLDYPSDKLQVVLACDGCTDNTAQIARECAAQPLCTELNITVLEFTENRGKVAVLNDVVSRTQADLVALSDVSALISVDALLIAAAHFEDPRVGVLNSYYRLLEPGSIGEENYWKYQCDIKAREALLGSALGAHGAFYIFRRDLFEPLDHDIINDDFVLPMKIVAKGYIAAQDNRIHALELEKSNDNLDKNRRLRISAGNLQQLLRLKSILSPKYKGVAFAFASGKALRVMMPFLMIIAYFGAVALSATHPFFALAAVGQTLLYGLAVYSQVTHRLVGNKLVKTLNYILSGYYAGLRGALHYISVKKHDPWRRANVNVQAGRNSLWLTHMGKRMFDLVFATLGLLLTLPLFPIIALAIKVDSAGPVIYKQTRVGRAHPNYTELFSILKFRTMTHNAEKVSGAVWASKQDPRITKVGLFLRKTRLDELPQFINVLKGEMSLIGPRPERPVFYKNLIDAIPFYAERTYGVLPGISGLAQVTLGYDTDIEDVRAKVGLDFSYSMSLYRPITWLLMDLKIALSTLVVVISKKGQ